VLATLGSKVAARSRTVGNGPSPFSFMQETVVYGIDGG